MQRVFSFITFIRVSKGQGMGLHICILSIWETEERGEFKTSLGYLVRPYLKIPRPLKRQRQVDPCKSKVSLVYIVSSGPCLKTKQKRLNNIKLTNKVTPYIIRTHLLYVSNLDNKLVSVRHSGGSPASRTC